MSREEPFADVAPLADPDTPGVLDAPPDPHPLRGVLRLAVKISSALLATDDPAAVLEPILADGADAFGFSQAFLYVVGPDRRHLRLTHAVNATASMRAVLGRLDHGTPLCGRVAETLRPLAIAGLQAGSEPDHETYRSLGFDAYAGFPVLSGGELCAVIAFAATGAPAFDADALAFFETVATLMSVAYERLDQEAALAETGAYWRSLFERLSEGFVVGEVIRDGSGQVTDWRYVEVNRASGDLFGIDPRTVVGRTIREVLPGVEEEWVDEFARVVATGIPTTFLREVKSIGRWYEGRVFAIGAARFGVIFLEVTDRVQADARRTAQLALNDRLGDLGSSSEMTLAASQVVGTTLDVIRAGFGRLDAAVEYVEIEADWTAPGWTSIVGRHRLLEYGDIRDGLSRGEPLVIKDVRTDPRTRDAPGPMLDLGIVSLVNVPVRDRGRTVAVFIVQDSKPRNWSVETLSFLFNVAERLEAGVARVRAEDEQRLLNEEISHRLKNTLAMVLSIAKQTLRAIPERAPVEAFEKRIRALATAHDVLLHRTRLSAPMREVVRAVMEAAGQGERVHASGPDLDLGPRATLSLSLLLHELATNAVKYGALSVPGGRVSVAWRVDGEAAGGELVLDWAEHGGPPPAAPTDNGRKGFGSRLIGLGLAGAGGVDLRYPAEGLRATMRASLDTLQSP